LKHQLKRAFVDELLYSRAFNTKTDSITTKSLEIRFQIISKKWKFKKSLEIRFQIISKIWKFRKGNQNEETLKFSTRLSSDVLYWKVGAKLIQGMIWNEGSFDSKIVQLLNQNERFLTGTFKYLLMKQDQELLLFMTLKEMDLLISKKIQCSSSPDPNWTTKCVAFTKTLKQMITASDGEAFHKLQISNAFIWRIHTQHQSPI
jgi:hypothetical protein